MLANLRENKENSAFLWYVNYTIVENSIPLKFIIKLVDRRGLEPRTSSMPWKHSTTELTAQNGGWLLAIS